MYRLVPDIILSVYVSQICIFYIITYRHCCFSCIGISEYGSSLCLAITIDTNSFII